MTVDDVIWTFETLRTKGHPLYRSYYAQVASVEKTGPRTVKFTFKGNENRELPVILGQLPVLSKAYCSGRDFAKTTLDAPLGSGPYQVESLEPGRSIVGEAGVTVTTLRTVMPVAFEPPTTGDPAT